VLDPSTGLVRDRAVWLVLAALIVTQLLAFFLLCTQQVRRAEERRAAAGVQPMSVECQHASRVPGCRPQAHPPTTAQAESESTIAAR
jgi:predicted metal-binding membrane protein